MNVEVLKKNLSSQLPSQLVEELLLSYAEVKSNFNLRKLRINEVEGGRFAEAAFRIIEHKIDGKYTPLGTPLDTEYIIDKASQTPRNSLPDSIRLYIPRTLRVIYDIRNNRDVAHLADGIDPNIQDATFVVSCCDWVLAELIRLHHFVPPEEAQSIVEQLVERQIPTLQDFDGFIKTLHPSWGPKERVLAILYRQGNQGMNAEDLKNSLKESQQKNFLRLIKRLEFDEDLIHTTDSNVCILTIRGVKWVEHKGLLDFNG